MQDHDPRYRTLQEVARRAGAIALDFYRRRSALAIELKGPADFVTIADRDVEHAIRGALHEKYPADAFLGEETASAFDGTLDRCWVVDPIDGTHNFLRGVPYWNVAIAYVEEGRTMLGAVYDPVHDELWHARRGDGAWCTTGDGATSPLTVAPTSALPGAYIALGHHDRHPEPRYLAIRERLMQEGAAMRNFGSAALQLAHVAAGRLDAFAELELSAWDALAGLLLVEEAGGYAAPFRPAKPAAKAACLGCAPALAGALRTITGVG